MIVKIWPIMADYADDPQKVGGEEGLRNTLEYITDEEKVIVKKNDLPKMPLLERDDLHGQGANPYGDLSVDDTFRVMIYMANEEKIKGKYISTYLCDQEVALEQFKNAREIVLNNAGVIRDKETGALAYHIVQSFPEGLEISDEEVHQCGVELCQKIGLHQAVICSHVHPEVDEHSGEVHGRCKHNHILINAYIHPDKWDPERPGRLKYNDCDETYAQLRAWNDEIAIEHGLPIIRNPDNERSYSWKEADEANKGLSWMARMRTDIEETRRAVDNWEDFKKEMEAQGYSIRDNVKYVSYTAPDGTHTARGKTLGKEYTKQSLELYWNIRKHCYRTVEPEEKADGSPSLLDILQNTSGVLRAAVPLGTEGHGEANRYYYLPLKNVQHSYESVSTYFNYDKLYDICDEQNRPVIAATGAEILACIEALRGARNKEKDIPEVKVAPEERRTSTKSKRRYYTYALYINSRTKQPYRTSLYDENGRRRSALELLFLLAATVIKKESDLWAVEDIPKGKETDVIYAPRNWKIQSSATRS